MVKASENFKYNTLLSTFSPSKTICRKTYKARVHSHNPHSNSRNNYLNVNLNLRDYRLSYVLLYNSILLQRVRCVFTIITIFIIKFSPPAQPFICLDTLPILKWVRALVGIVVPETLDNSDGLPVDRYQIA